MGLVARRAGAHRHSAADRDAPLLEPQAAGDLSRPINLANIERLDASAVEALEKYVAAGGGVAFFLGEHATRSTSTTCLYRGGKGLFPVPLARQAELPVDRLEPAPDVQVGPHFIFRVFAAKRNTFLQTVTVERYFAVPEGWRPPRDSTVRVAARLRNGAPLVVERSFGKGRVMAFLTTAAPDVEQLGPQSELRRGHAGLAGVFVASGPPTGESRLVGSPLELSLDPAVYQPQVRFTSPEAGGGAGDRRQRGPRPRTERWPPSFADTDLSGFYEARLHADQRRRRKPGATP